MYENKNKHYAINVFSERNVRNVIFRFVFTCFNWFPIVPCWFYYGDIANLGNHILNIDQLEP